MAMRLAYVCQTRSVLKDRLHFLPGYPVGQVAGAVLWMPAPRPGHPLECPPIRLTADDLRRAVRGWKKLIAEVAEGLPQAVDNVEDWTRGVPILLEHLKRAVHAGDRLPPAPFDAGFALRRRASARAACCVRARPGLRPLVNSLAWTCCLSPDRVDAAMEWIDTHARQLEVLVQSPHIPAALNVALLLYHLDAEQPHRHRSQTLLRYLGHPVAFDVPTSGGDDYIQAWLTALKEAQDNQLAGPWRPPTRPDSLGTHVLQFTRSFAQQPDRKVRDRMLRLLELLLSDDDALLPQWRRWWSRVENWSTDVHTTIQRFSRRPELQLPTGRKRRRLASARKALYGPLHQHVDLLRLQGETWLRELPLATTADPALGFAQIAPFLTGALRTSREASPPTLSESETQRTFATLSEFLECARGGSDRLLPRVAVFEAIHSFPFFIQTRSLAAWLELFLSSRLPPDLWVTGLRDFELCWTIKSMWNDPETLARGLEALHHWTQQLRRSENLSWPLLVVRGNRDDRLVPTFLEALSQNQGRVLTHTLNADCILPVAAQLAQNRQQFLAVIDWYRDARDDCEKPCESMQSIHQDLTRAGWPVLASELVVQRQRSRWDLLDQLRTLASALGGKTPPPARSCGHETATWIREYPSQLQVNLGALHALVPDAQGWARNAWQQAGPDERELTRQLTHIEQKLMGQPDDARLQRGLVNKRQQRASPSALCRRKLDTMQARLDRHVHDCVVRQWTDSLRGSIAQRFSALLEGMSLPDPWLTHPRHQVVRQVLAGIFSLTGWARALALRMLQVRLTRREPPWHLYDEEPNRRFLARLGRMQIDVTPWLHAEPLTVELAPGRSVQLAFEQDPLEVFYMGGYFGTCLSPGGCNFFSTVAVAADINKQVLYARDQNGHVVGRCLLALTHNGGLLTFRPYCFWNDVDFGQAVSEFARELAERMHSTVYPSGQVDCLVAADWYDDGSHDLCQRLPCFRDGSLLRRQLVDVPLEEVLPVLARELAPLAVNDLTLPLLLGLPEFVARPELVVPLQPVIRQSGYLPHETLVQVTKLAVRAGDRDFARYLFRHRLLREFRPNLGCGYGCDDEPFFQTLTQLDPSLMLRTLRQTRPSGVRRDEQESRVRRRLVASAHEALGRSDLARRLMATGDRAK